MIGKASLACALALVSTSVLASCKRETPVPQLANADAAAGRRNDGPAAPLAGRRSDDPATAEVQFPARTARFSEEGMLAEGARFVSETAFRRAVLETTFANRENTYARVRLASYARGTSGWDLLPEWTPRAVPLTETHVAAIRRGEAPELPATTPPLWDGKTPATMREWIALGERAFFSYPMRAEIFLRYAVEKPSVGEAVGVVRARDGTYPGSVLFIDDNGRTEVGLTCAQCHTRVVDGVVRAGEARREFDYGRLRLRYHADTGAPVDPELARRMAKWGPGRADVTEDETEDPVAIPDLWGLRDQTALTQAGTVINAGPSSLAIRQDTQLTQTNHERLRPPRVIAWALAMYLYALTPPNDARASDGGSLPAPASIARGRAVFDGSCRTCHDNAAYGGDPVEASRVGTEAQLANGRARGTGRYRPPALVRVRDAAPYFHDGSVSTLEDVLGEARLAPSYVGPLGKGAIAGHVYGTRLPAPDRAALLAFLRSI